MMTRALHSKGWTLSLKNVQDKLWGACALCGLEELEAQLAPCGCSSLSCLAGRGRAHMTDKLHTTSESCLHCVWEQGNTIAQCWLLETICAATSPGLGDFTSHRHCHCCYHWHTALHKNDSFISLRIFQISGGCHIQWNRIKTDGTTLISHQCSTKERLGFLSCRIQLLGINRNWHISLLSVLKFSSQLH